MIVLLIACIQSQEPSRHDPQRRPAGPQVNFRLDEWFDEEREDGVTDARHPKTLDVRHPNGGMSFNTYCHWRKRDKAPASVFEDDEQDEQDDRPPDRQLLPPPALTPFRAVSTGGKLQLPTSLAVPNLEFLSARDGATVDFDSVDAESMPGFFLSTTIAVSGLELRLFADYVTGRFSADPEERTFEIPGERMGDPPLTITEAFELAGSLWLMEVGVAPVLKRFSTDDGLFSFDVAVAAGVYFGRLTDVEVERSGSVTETIAGEERSLFGFFAGPTAHASVRLSSAFRAGIFGEFWRLFGDAEGWTGLSGVEIELAL